MIRIAERFVGHLAACATLLGLVGIPAGCGDDDGSSDQASLLIQASEGGVVAMANDDTALNVPANALSQDTTITLSYGELSDYGPLEHARARTIELEPAGLTLNVPAALTIDPGAPAIGAEQTVTVYQWMDGAWTNPRAALVSLGLVSTTVSYLAPLAIVVEDPVAGPTGTIAGGVYHIYLETPIVGVSFTLLDGTTEIDTAVSGEDGTFYFEDVPVGTYTVHSEIDEADNCYDDPVDKEAIVTEDATTDVFFGFVPAPCG